MITPWGDPPTQLSVTCDAPTFTVWFASPLLAVSQIYTKQESCVPKTINVKKEYLSQPGWKLLFLIYKSISYTVASAIASIVYSGTRLHLWWLLKTPLLFTEKHASVNCLSFKAFGSRYVYTRYFGDLNKIDLENSTKSMHTASSICPDSHVNRAECSAVRDESLGEKNRLDSSMMHLWLASLKFPSMSVVVQTSEIIWLQYVRSFSSPTQACHRQYSKVEGFTGCKRGTRYLKHKLWRQKCS